MEIGKFSKFFENKISLQKKNSDFKSINFLVSAKWGRGKTKLKNDFLNLYKDKTEWLIFDVNIWLSNFKYIDEIIFIELIKYIKKYNGLNKYKKQIQKIIKNVFSSVLEKNEIISFLRNVIEESKDFSYGKIVDEINNNYKTFFALEELINFILKKLKKEKIIFLYDELDRCDDVFIKDFFSRIKQLFSYENVIHIVFANENYINTIFHNLNSDEQFIDKYFNNVYKIKPNIVDVIEEKWKKITSFEDKLFKYYDNNSSNYKKFKICDLFLQEVSYRDLVKNNELISNFFHNFSTMSPSKNINSIWYKIEIHDDILILFIVFLILKGHHDIDSIDELQKIIDKYSIIDYFDLDNLKLKINEWLFRVHERNYGSYIIFTSGENVLEPIEKWKIGNEHDFLFVISIQIKRIIAIYFNNLIEINNINKNYIDNLKNEPHININKLLSLANKKN